MSGVLRFVFRYCVVFFCHLCHVLLALAPLGSIIVLFYLPCSGVATGLELGNILRSRFMRVCV